MSILNASILGVIQGLTEFLPISSSAHLLLSEQLLKFNPPGVFLEVFLHFGTTLSVLFLFRKRILEILRSIFPPNRSATGFSLFLLLLVGSLPAGFVGVTLHSFFENFFDSQEVVLWSSSLLVVTGIVLFFTRFSKMTGNPFGIWDALWIGIAQSFAILPGLSRSGLTISTGLFLGKDREKVVEFSFLLSIPAVLGAMGVEWVSGFNGLTGFSQLNLLNPINPLMTSLWVGAFVSFLSGIFAIKVLLSIVRRGRLDWFAYYCWGVGLAGILFSIKN